MSPPRRPLPIHALRSGTAAPPPPALDLRLLPVPVAQKTRTRSWEMASNLHCSVVGTCLTTSDIRHLLRKLNDPEADTASEHAIHGKAVSMAAQNGVSGKLLNKMLDQRHDRLIRRFARAKTAVELRALWDEASEAGDIPGGYWAALSHPMADRGLVQHVFGEVHMLSHLIGRASRVDIRRVRALEGELERRERTVADQEARLQTATQERVTLSDRVAALEQELRIAQARLAERAEIPDLSDMQRRLTDEQARNALLAERLAAAERGLAIAECSAGTAEQQLAELSHELAVLEANLDLPESDGNGALAQPDLVGRTLLYVGGRPRLLNQIRTFAARHGGRLLTHDGGIEEATSLLPGLVSQAEAVLLPIDCVSHTAMDQVRRLCRGTDKRFLPLRTASLSCFLAATASLATAGGDRDADATG